MEGLQVNRTILSLYQNLTHTANKQYLTYTGQSLRNTGAYISFI